VAFIIDGEAYFRALHEALSRARRSIFIVGWDLHSEVRLIRSGAGGGYPEALGELLNTLVREQPKLQIYLLSWDFAMIYAMEREFFPRYKLKWRAHRRIHFSLDGHNPVGGSQHQKLVVIDDALAFAGGLDVSQWRWDTSEHLPEDDRRLDPEKPVSPDVLLDHFISPRQQPAAFRHALKIFIMFAVVAGLAGLWRWTPLGDYVDLEGTRSLAAWIQQQPITPLLVAGVYVLGGLVALPVTLMIIATVLVFGTWLGLLYALVGSWLSAVAVFGFGRWMGRNTARRFAGSLLNRLSKKLTESGFLTVVTFRIVPVAPFSVINLIAGVSEIRWRDFALGTLVGMLPGVIAVVLLVDRIAASLRHPDLGQVTILLASISLVGLGLVGLRKWVQRQRSQKAS
jgi:uncharacterized membrane protein YdjX (TVP38/TMEM64 family)